MPKNEEAGEMNSQPMMQPAVNDPMPDTAGGAEPSPAEGPPEAGENTADDPMAAPAMEPATEAQPSPMESMVEQEPEQPPPTAREKEEEWNREGVRPFLDDDGQAITRIAILHNASNKDKAEAISLLLNKFRRKELEKTLGGVVEVVNYSRAPSKPGPRGVIYYREGHMRAALQVARMMPERQEVLPMVGQMAINTTVDVEIYLNR